jgi:hypothetical protein
LELDKRFENPLIFVMEPSLVAIEERERAAGAGERFEGDG